MITIPMTLKISTPLPTIQSPHTVQERLVKLAKIVIPAGFIKVSKSAEYSPNPWAPPGNPRPIYPKVAKTLRSLRRNHLPKAPFDVLRELINPV